MKERPILFSAPMVRAILDGRKTMTRRVVKTKSVKYDVINGVPCPRPIPCPFGKPGDRLWVREEHYAFGYWKKNGQTKTGQQKWSFVRFPSEPYRYNDNQPEDYLKSRDRENPVYPRWYKRLARFMPRTASRITLEITGEGVERLQDITEEDALLEGIIPHPTIYFPGQYRLKFKELWQSINGPGSWDENPAVWVITFKRIEP